MCEHTNFTASVSVARLSEEDGGVITGYSADLKICCADCGLPFQFIGVPNGYSPFEPKASIDNEELRLPITPSTGKMVFESPDTSQN